jgi:hypothetical protein
MSEYTEIYWEEIDLESIKTCPNCDYKIQFSDEFKYNGFGPPPSYSIACGDCGMQGPSALGFNRGDYIGAINSAIESWNNLPRRLD